MNPHIARDAQEVIENLGSLNARFAGKTVVLTGAAGFLGAQFCHYFMRLNENGVLSHPCQLLAYDSLIRGKPGWLERLASRPHFTLLVEDISKAVSYPAADFIIHAASIASPHYYRRLPIETMDVNVNGLRHLLDVCVQRPVESFLFLSSSEVYGDPDPRFIPTAEDYRGNVSCTGPRACYDESKRYGETLCVSFWQAKKVPVKVVRPFNNYGPGLRISDRRVLPDFFSDIVHDRDVTLLSDGSTTRTFCYAADAITGHLLALLSSHNGEAFNIGTEQPEISMAELAKLVIRTSRKALGVRFATSEDRLYLTDNPQRRCPTIGKARRLLNYEPHISLEEGLARTYAYYQGHGQLAAD